MRKALEQIEVDAKKLLENVSDIKELEELRIRYLGKKGELTAILKNMGGLSAEERPVIGQLANKVRADIEGYISAKQAEITALETTRRLAAEKLDVTMPGKKIEIGKVHPLNIVLDELKEIFLGMGFDIAEGPEVELDYYNFEVLNLPPDQTNITEQTEHNIDTGSLQFDWTSPNKRHYFSLYTSAQYINRSSYYGTDKNPNAYGNTTDITAVAGGQYRFSWMQNTVLPADVSAGIEYTYDNLHDQMLGYNRDMRQEVGIIGGYLQNEWKNKSLSVLIGARLDKHSLMQQVVCSPRASVRYTPIPEVVLRATYASGYRAPQAYDEDLHIGAVGGEVSLIELDPNLRPEYSHSVSLSGDIYKSFGAWETNLTLEGFFTRINDVFTLVDVGHDAMGNLIRMRTNSSGAYVGGLNVEAKIAYRNLFTFQIGYTFQKSKYIDPVTWSENPNIAPQTRMFRTPDHYGYALATVTPFKGFNITINGKATGSMLVQHAAGYIAEDEEVITPSFWDLGAKLSYDIPLYKLYTLQVNAGVKNVLNSFQTDFDQGINRDSGYIYGPTLPRTFFIGLNLKL